MSREGVLSLASRGVDPKGADVILIITDWLQGVE